MTNLLHIKCRLFKLQQQTYPFKFPSPENIKFMSVHHTQKTIWRCAYFSTNFYLIISFFNIPHHLPNFLSHDIKNVIFFQNCVNLLRSDYGSCSETCLISLDNENWGVDIKGEEVTGTEEELNSQPEGFQTTKAEPEVSFVTLWQAFYSCVMVAV